MKRIRKIISNYFDDHNYLEILLHFAIGITAISFFIFYTVFACISASTCDILGKCFIFFTWSIVNALYIAFLTIILD